MGKTISFNVIYILFGNNSDNQNSKVKERTRSIKYKKSASKKYVTKSDVLTFVLDGSPVHKATEATCQNVNTEIGRNKGGLSRPTSVKSVQSVL